MKASRRFLRAGFLLVGCCELLCLWKAAGMAMQARAVIQSSGAAVVALDRTEHDFGIVGTDPVRASFVVRNSGGRRLVINEDACASCGLTVTPLPIVIGPGCRAEIVVELQTQSLTGAVHREASYTTNDPALPRFSLVLHAQRASHDE